MKCCIGICAYMSEKGLPAVFDNIDEIAKLFEEVVVIISKDFSPDKTDEICLAYERQKKVMIHEPNHGFEGCRTEKIANARNAILKEVYTNYNHWDFFVMMDTNQYSCVTKIDASVLESYLTRKDWDALSFNRDPYYDIWALSFSPFLSSCWHFEKALQTIDRTKTAFIAKLNSIKDDKLLEVVSAFGGFAIYRINKFDGCCYNGKFDVDLFTKIEYIRNTEAAGSKLLMRQVGDCEHRGFHIMAKRKNNARIMVSPKKLFPHCITITSNNTLQYSND